MKLTRRTITIGSVALAGLLVTTAVVASGRFDFSPVPKDVTLKGKLVDLQSYMTGEFTSADEEKCTRDCIRNGVPPALDTEDGLVVLGKGTKGPKQTIMAYAFKEVEVEGKLYEKSGLKYLDIESVKGATEEDR